MFFERFQAIMPGRPLILGHRGAPRHARENSLESFQAALDAGADGIELDVQCTADHVPITHHDDHLPSGEKLADLPYKQLKSLALKAGFELPTLAEVFRIAAGKGLLNIELKRSGGEETVLKLAAEMLPRESYAVSSFNPSAVSACRKIAPDVPALLIVWGMRDGQADLERLRALDASGIAFESNHLTRELAELFHKEKYPVFAWTVNNPQEAAQLGSWGVTGLITDTPAELVTHFAALKANR